ncbi:polyamine-modulated factor 1 [Neopsephotus bourkii]|uniref:polyamine-modulated factor 1 n=1 Tax=Neopsephotus bourkii TaxID=309878 RepID=UPI002AA58D5D|nr:polyamine-modulated factor 1 [Neopsephotus bourkii]
MAEARSDGDTGGDTGGDGGVNGGDGGGSPGPGRAELFNTVVDTFLEKLVAAGSYPRFASCYRSFYKLQPELTKSIYNQFVSQLQASIRAEIQEVMEEGNLKAVLDSLDKIVEEGKSQEEPAWRPSGIPEEDARSALVPPLLQHRSCLLRALRTKREENRRAAQAVLDARGRIQELQQRLQAHSRGWKVPEPPGPPAWSSLGAGAQGPSPFPSQALNGEQQELVLSLQQPQ